MSNGHYGDITIDVSSAPYETGFKFNTLPFGGMTIDAGNAVRVGSAAEIKLVPPEGHPVIIGTTGDRPTPSEALRGALFVVREAPGSQDRLEICLKTSANDYAWKVVTVT